MRIEKQILSNLILNEDYLRKTIAFLKEDYFLDSEYREVFKVIRDYASKYNAAPAKSALLITLQDNKRIDEQLYVKCEELINGLVMVDVDLDWLVDQSEKFCKDKALYNAVMHSIQIIDGQDKAHTLMSSHILSDALVWDLIITLVTTMLVTQSLVVISTIVSRKRFHLTLNTSTRLLKVDL